MATRDDSSCDSGSQRLPSPITVAGILLGIYVAMYLAVVGIVHVLTSPDAAAAIAPGSSLAPSVAAPSSPSPAGVGESPSSDSLGQVSERTNNRRERRSTAVTDSKRRFN